MFFNNVLQHLNQNNDLSTILNPEHREIRLQYNLQLVKKANKSIFCLYIIRTFIVCFIDFQMFSLSASNRHISSFSTLALLLHLVPRVTADSITTQRPFFSSGPTICVYERMCYIRDEHHASGNKASYETLPSKPLSGPLLPPSPSSNQHGGGKTGGLRGRKTSIRTQRLTGGTPPPSHPPPSAGRAPGPEHRSLSGYRALMCQLEEPTHTYNDRAPTELI